MTDNQVDLAAEIAKAVLRAAAPCQAAYELAIRSVLDEHMAEVNKALMDATSYLSLIYHRHRNTPIPDDLAEEMIEVSDRCSKIRKATGGGG